MLLPYSNETNNFSSLLPNGEWSFREAKRSETNYISHGYHRYPAKFIPQLVHRLILEYTDSGDLVLDPFGGCCTTLVEAKVLGRRSLGFDINPVAKLITDTKTTPINPATLRNSLDQFIQDLRNVETNSAVEHSERTKYWFSQEIISELDGLYKCILKIKTHKVRR